MLLTGSRGGFLALSLGALVVMFGKYTNVVLPKQRMNRKLLAWSGVALIVLVSFSYLPSEIQARYSLHGLMGGDNQGAYRLIIWGHAMRLFFYSPFAGIGVGSFATSMVSGFRYVGAHNMFLLVLIETGIIGLLLFLAFLFSLLRQLHAQSNSLGLGVLFGTLVLSFFLDALTAKFLWNGIIFSVLVLASPRPDQFGST